ncbi:DUF4189 domain-containing protein [Nocardia sp. NPDC088792]|uniref:DUF4189 domain-containing protein n=1 Tax=Nocardia sp. NPDC088792 TaxID=3364332 RepID=UPI003823125E
MVLAHKVFGVVAIVAAAAGGSTAGVAGAEPGPDGRLYGSLATETLGGVWRVMWAVDRTGWSESDDAALQHCRFGHCVVVARFVDGCGSVARRGSQLLGGIGSTREEAESAAVNAFAAPDVASISAGSPNVLIVHTECTANAG